MTPVLQTGAARRSKVGLVLFTLAGLSLPSLAFAADEAFVLRSRAAQLATNGDCSAALPLIDQAKAIDPAGDDAAALMAGRCLISTENFAAAKPALERAVAHDPNSGDARLALGVAKYHLGEKDAARADLEHAQKMLPNNPGGGALPRHDPARAGEARPPPSIASTAREASTATRSSRPRTTTRRSRTRRPATRSARRSLLRGVQTERARNGLGRSAQARPWRRRSARRAGGGSEPLADRSGGPRLRLEHLAAERRDRAARRRLPRRRRTRLVGRRRRSGALPLERLGRWRGRELHGLAALPRGRFRSAFHHGFAVARPRARRRTLLRIAPEGGYRVLRRRRVPSLRRHPTRAAPRFRPRRNGLALRALCVQRFPLRRSVHPTDLRSHPTARSRHSGTTAIGTATTCSRATTTMIGLGDSTTLRGGVFGPRLHGRGRRIRFHGRRRLARPSTDAPHALHPRLAGRREYDDYESESSFLLAGEADRAREDLIGTAGVVLTRPITDWLSVSARYQYLNNDSNTELFNYDRHIVGAFVTIGLLR